MQVVQELHSKKIDIWFQDGAQVILNQRDPGSYKNSPHRDIHFIAYSGIKDLVKLVCTGMMTYHVCTRDLHKSIPEHSRILERPLLHVLGPPQSLLSPTTKTVGFRQAGRTTSLNQHGDKTNASEWLGQQIGIRPD